jgi:hypothetical protein
MGWRVDGQTKGSTIIVSAAMYYRTQDTDMRRQSKDGTAVLYSFLLRLQFLALAGSTDHSGRSSSCLESSGEGDMLLVSVLGVFDSILLFENCT